MTACARSSPTACARPTASCKRQIEKAKERGEIARDADPAALAYLATATLHTLAIRSRAGLPRKELDALVEGGDRGDLRKAS